MTRAAVAVLDTSVLIDMPEDLAGRAAAFCVSAITLAELQFAVAVATNPIDLAERQLLYLEVLRDYDAVGYTEQVAHWHGTFMAMDRRAGRNPRARMADLAIAATAKTLGAPVVTRNPRDFASVADLVEIIAV